MKKILILGGGYAGVATAINLKDVDAQVTLVNRTEDVMDLREKCSKLEINFYRVNFIDSEKNLIFEYAILLFFKVLERLNKGFLIVRPPR